jgi:hypothetical protein
LKEKQAVAAVCQAGASVVGSLAAAGIEAKAPTESSNAAAIVPIFVTALSITVDQPSSRQPTPNSRTKMGFRRFGAIARFLE